MGETRKIAAILVADNPARTGEMRSDITRPLADSFYAPPLRSRARSATIALDQRRERN